jgi:hypothetical protein
MAEAVTLTIKRGPKNGMRAAIKWSVCCQNSAKVAEDIFPIAGLPPITTKNPVPP